MKRQPLEHHFCNEKGNFGITHFFWDKLLHSCYVRPERSYKNATVLKPRDMPEIAKRYPWLSQYSSGEVLSSPKEKDRYKSSFEEVDKIQDIR